MVKGNVLNCDGRNVGFACADVEEQCGSENEESDYAPSVGSPSRI